LKHVKNEPVINPKYCDAWIVEQFVASGLLKPETETHE
jgi:hypothetical protein